MKKIIISMLFFSVHPLNIFTMNTELDDFPSHDVQNENLTTAITSFEALTLEEQQAFFQVITQEKSAEDKGAASKRQTWFNKFQKKLKFLEHFEGEKITCETLINNLIKITTDQEKTYFVDISDSISLEQPENKLIQAFIVYDNEKDALESCFTINTHNN